MSTTDNTRLARRGFLARVSAAAAGFTAWTAMPGATTSSSARLLAGATDPDAWIDRLTGSDRLLLHVHQRLMPGLGGARNIIENGRAAYGVAEAENSVAIAAHGPAIAGLFTDATWQRFGFGERYRISDPGTGAPAARNPFLAPQDGAPPDATVPALLERGVVIIACNAAMRKLAQQVAGAMGAPEAMHRELVAGLVPGVTVVPDLFVAISHAQKRGVGYLFVD